MNGPFEVFGLSLDLHSVRCHCRLGGRKGIRPVKTEYWYAGGTDMTGALHVLRVSGVTTATPSPPAASKNHNDFHCWYWFIQVVLEYRPLKDC